MLNFISSKDTWEEITTFVIADLIVLALTAGAPYLRSKVVAHKTTIMKFVYWVSVTYFELAAIYALVVVWARCVQRLSLALVWFNLFFILAARLMFMTADYLGSRESRSMQEKENRLLALHKRLPQSANASQDTVTYILNEVTDANKHGQKVMRAAEWKFTYYLMTTALATWAAIFFAIVYR